MNRILLVLTTCAIVIKSQGQDLAGTWVESSKSKFSPLDFLFLRSTDDILELTVTSDSLLSGVVHSNYNKGRYTHVKISGIIHWKDSSVIIKDKKILDHNINMKVYNYCYCIEFLTLSIANGKYVMTGKTKDLSASPLRCPTETVTWIKSLINSPNKRFDDKRAMDIQELIEIDTEEADSIKCSIFDNGEIDDDTVSIYYNDSLVLSKQRLSANPLEFYISLPKEHRTSILKMYAENLGRIPPNTGVMIINTRKNRYTLSLESNLSNSGSVQFFLKK